MVGVFKHHSRDISLTVHVDDVLATGRPEQLDWLRATLQTHYEVKSSVIGPGGESSGTFLKRTITWTDHALIWQADDRHADEVVSEWASSKFRQIDVPVTNEASRVGVGEFLSPDVARKFRSAAARIQYISRAQMAMCPL